MSDKTLGQVAFEAHRDFLGGVRPWSDVREPEREVWEETADAVKAALVFDEGVEVYTYKP